MVSPKVSVIMPAFNVEAYICKAIQSILEQSYAAWELVVVDDGSTDGTRAVVEALLTKEDRIRLVLHAENKGVSEARNTGLRHSSGKYVCFVDPDDWIEQSYLTQMVQYAEMHDLPLVISGLVYDYDGRVDFPLAYMQAQELMAMDARYEMLLLQKFTWTPCDKLFLRELIEENDLQFDSLYLLAEDLVFCWEYLKYISKAGFLPLYAYHYCVHPTSVTHRRDTDARLTSVAAIKYCYEDAAEMPQEIRRRLWTLYVKENASCIKDLIANDVYVKQIMKMQSVLRKNWKYMLLDWRISFAIKAAILFFCTPYSVCKFVWRWAGDYLVRYK